MWEITQLHRRAWVMFRAGNSTMDICALLKTEFHREVKEHEVYNAIGRMQTANYEGELDYPYKWRPDGK